MSKDNVHVVTHNGGWAVKQEGTSDVMSTHDSQQRAVEAASAFGRRNDVNVVIHDEDGSFQDVRRFGNGAGAATQPQSVERMVAAGAPSVIRWGAVVAGLFVTIAAHWVLYLVGASLGVTVLDVTNTLAIGASFGIGAAIWLVLSTLVAFFVGSFLASELTGLRDPKVGVLHGAVVWSVAVTSMIVLGVWGLSWMANSAMQAAQATTLGTQAAASNIAATATSATEEFLRSPFVDEMQRDLKDEAARRIANSTGEELTRSEAETAIEKLDAEATQRIAADLLQGDLEEARTRLRENTDLTEAELTALFRGVEREFRAELGLAASDDPNDLDGDLGEAAREFLAGRIAQLDRSGGVDVSQNDVRTALNSMESRDFQRAAGYLVMGDPNQARTVLVANSTLEP